MAVKKSSSNQLKILKRKQTHGTGFKTLTPKEMFQALSIALEKVKSVNTSANLQNEIC